MGQNGEGGAKQKVHPVINWVNGYEDDTHWDRYVGASYKIGFFTFGLHSGMEYIHLIPFSRVLKKMFQKLTLRNFSSWLNLVNLL